METQNIKRKLQTQSVYRAEAILPTTFNYLPNNLKALKNKEIWAKVFDEKQQDDIWKKVKSEVYLGYKPTNKLINKMVKEKIYSKAFYKKYFRPITIDCKGNEGPCRYQVGFITLKTWADDAVLLHELAHQYGRQHDSRFATAYLMLVGRFIGHKAQVELMASMRKNNVEWNGSFVHSKQCYLENGFPELAVNAGGQCTTGATKMNLGWQKRNLY